MHWRVTLALSILDSPNYSCVLNTLGNDLYLEIIPIMKDNKKDIRMKFKKYNDVCFPYFNFWNNVSLVSTDLNFINLQSKISKCCILKLWNVTNDHQVRKKIWHPLRLHISTYLVRRRIFFWYFKVHVILFRYLWEFRNVSKKIQMSQKKNSIIRHRRIESCGLRLGQAPSA